MNKPNIVDVLVKYEEEYLTTNKYDGYYYESSDVQKAMEEYGKQMWNAALDWAKENVELTTEIANPYDQDTWYETIDKDSIEKGKIK